MHTHHQYLFMPGRVSSLPSGQQAVQSPRTWKDLITDFVPLVSKFGGLLNSVNFKEVLPRLPVWWEGSWDGPSFHKWAQFFPAYWTVKVFFLLVWHRRPGAALFLLYSFFILESAEQEALVWNMLGCLAGKGKAGGPWLPKLLLAIAPTVSAYACWSRPRHTVQTRICATWRHFLSPGNRKMF